MTRLEQLTNQNNAILDTYLMAFKDCWGLSYHTTQKLGSVGNEVFEAEFAIHGAKAYETSVIMPIRNAKQSHWVMLERHRNLFEGKVYPSPILDYGCGVGYQLLWLKDLGYPAEQLWGYDVPGPQADLTKHVFSKEGINFGIPKDPKTIFCFHVLEHLEDPFTMVDYLRGLGGKLYASCVGDAGHGHLVDKAKANEVIAYLRKEDNFVEDHWSNRD